MNKIDCLIIVGKPGAGKSTVGSMLTSMLAGEYLSLGSFMREKLGIPDPHIGINKNRVYEALYKELLEKPDGRLLILDCHPYPEEDFEALQTFLTKPELNLKAVLQVVAEDVVALRRLEKRPRPGQRYEDRLKYFNDNQRFIERLLEGVATIRIENNLDFDDVHALEEVVRTAVSELQD